MCRVRPPETCQIQQTDFNLDVINGLKENMWKESDYGIEKKLQKTEKIPKFDEKHQFMKSMMLKKLQVR